MYNGNGGYSGNGSGGYTSIAGFKVKSIYLYAAGIIGVVVAIFFVMQFLDAGLAAHFSAVAGILLVIANLRELIGMAYSQRGSTALLNLLVGASLICAWLSQIVGPLLWIPAVLLVGIATPLILGRATVYSTYVKMARSTFDGVRRTIVR